VAVSVLALGIRRHLMLPRIVAQLRQPCPVDYA
jgi:hypothetical protein